jgi:hypothetical protein
MTDADAFKLLARQALEPRQQGGDRFKPLFEDADARSFIKPYDLHADPREKAARKAWYTAQLPSTFPKSGKVRVAYLYPCSFPTWLFKGGEPQDVSDADAALADQVWIAMALERERVKAAGVSGVVRTEHNERAAPVPGIRALNDRLAASAAAGRVRVVLEPYCGPLYGPPPPPPPPPPAAPPVFVRMTPGTTVKIASALNAALCRIKTGSYYRADCKGWRTVLSNELELSGSLYRYVIIRQDKVVRSDALDLGVTRGSPDQPLQLVVS